MHLLALVQNWLESLPGFIGLEAQTLTISLGARGPGNQQKHVEYIVGSG